MKPLREFGEIRHGNAILVPCQGRKENGEEHCCGMIRVPFEPPFPGSVLCSNADSGYWHRESGDTIDTITLTSSIAAGACGHFLIKNGHILKA